MEWWGRTCSIPVPLVGGKAMTGIKKTMKRIAILGLAVIMITVLPLLFSPENRTAYAESILYLSAAGSEQASPETYTVVSGNTTAWTAGWYVVNADTTIADRISVNGDSVNLILCNGTTLTAQSGITVASGAAFNIYAQTTSEGNMGALVATAVTDYSAGIGGTQESAAGSITINGGRITATGYKAAGIGAGSGGSVGQITINGGIIHAKDMDGSSLGAGIGGGDRDSGAVAGINLNGGIIQARGIGPGRDEDGITINISTGIKRIVATRISTSQNSNPIGAGGEMPEDCGMVFKQGGSAIPFENIDTYFYHAPSEWSPGDEQWIIRSKTTNAKVTIDANLQSEIATDKEYAYPGEKVTLTVTGSFVDASSLQVNDGAVALTSLGNNQYSFSMPESETVVSAASLHATYSVTVPKGMQITGTTQAADQNGKYLSGTILSFKTRWPHSASNVKNGDTLLTPDGDGIYSVTVESADINITADMHHDNPVNLSEAPCDIFAVDGDTLIGTTAHTVRIDNHAGITLSKVTITGGIVCEGNATITLAGMNTVSGAGYEAGIRIGDAGTTLTITGQGILSATGSPGGAGIGLGMTDGVDLTGGNVVIKGGRVTAVGGRDSDGIGWGYRNSSGTGRIGTVTVYDHISLVDASSIGANIVYMHVDGENVTDVTAQADVYFYISKEGEHIGITPENDDQFSITLDSGIENGEVTAAATAKTGEIVKLGVTPARDYTLDHIIVTDADHNSVTMTGTEFAMPKSDVTVSAVFRMLTAFMEEGSDILILQGNVNYNEVRLFASDSGENHGNYSSPVKYVVCEKGTVLPADSHELFCNFDNVRVLDLSNADISGWIDVNNMFSSCDSLETIYVSSSWMMPEIIVQGNKMLFSYCPKLQGGNGTAWSDNRREADRAVIDGKDGKPGYLTCPKVSFADGGGSGAMDDVYVTKDTEYTLPACTFSSPDSKLVFKEWSMKTGDAAAVTKVVGEKITVTANTVATATWKPKDDPVYTAPAANTLTYNGSEQALISAGSVTSGGKMLYCDKKDGTYSETIPAGKAAGDYTVYYQILETDAVNGVAPVAVHVSIAGKQATVRADDKSRFKGEADPELTATVTGMISGEAESLISFTLSREAGEEAGQYAITPAGKTTQGNYTVTYETGILTITEKPTYTVTVNAGSGDGSYEEGATVTITADSAPEGKTFDQWTSADGVAFTDAGSATTTFTMPAKAVTVTATWKEKADPIITKAPTAKTLTYTGAAQELVTADEADGGTMQYAPGSATEATGSYGTSIPAATEVGTWYVWYKVIGDSNHHDTEATCLAVKIVPASIAEASVTLSETSLAYTGAEQSVTVTAVELGNTKLTAGTDYEVSGETTGTDKGTYTVTVTGKGNYQDTATAKWSIGLTTPTISTVPTASAITWGQTLKDSALSGGAAKNGDTDIEGTFTWKNPAMAPAVSDSETTEYAVVFTPGDPEVYGVAECKVKLTVNKAPSAPATVSANNRTYDGTEQPLVTVDESTLVGGTMYYAVTTENTAPADDLYTTAIPAAADAGTWYVWYKAVGDENHQDTEVLWITVEIRSDVQDVTDVIDELPAAAEVTPENREAIEAARAAYEALTEEQKAKVPADTMKKLTDAEDKLVILQVTGEVSAQTGSDMTYTGKAIQLISAPTTALPEGYTMVYAVTTTKKAPKASAYTVTIPTATKAGTYYVWFKIQGEGDRTDTKAQCIPVTIEAPKVVDSVTANGGIYQLNHKKKTATFMQAKKKTATTLKINATVKANGKKYTVTAIAAKACKDLKKLTTLTIGAKVETIGESAFAACPKLKTVKGGAGVTTVGNSTFDGDTSLNSVAAMKNLKKIGDCAFRKTAIKSFALGAKITNIGKSAFESCSKLAKVTGGENLTKIGAQAFYRCKALLSFTIGAKVTKIGKNAFRECEALKTVTVKTSKLKGSNVGADAFKKIWKTVTFKVPKKIMKKYAKLFLAKGAPKNSKFRQLN